MARWETEPVLVCGRSVVSSCWLSMMAVEQRSYSRQGVVEPEMEAVELIKESL